jgi:glutathione S-transferase
MLKIFGFQTFNLGKVLLTAEELNLPYEFVTLNPMKGELATEDNLNRHPLGKMPSIDWDGYTLFESHAICRYLAEKSNSLYGDTPEQRAKVNQWIDCVGFHVGRHLSAHYFETIVRPRYFDASPDEKVVQESCVFLEKQLPPIQAHLSKNPFFAGEQLSIADTVGFNYFHIHEISKFSLSDYPAICEWYHKIKDRPAFKRASRHFPDGMLTM